MATDVTTRWATPDDARTLAGMRWDFRDDLHHVQGRRSFQEVCEPWLARELAGDRWWVPVAEHAGELIGCMFLEVVHKVPVPGQLRRVWGYVTFAHVAGSHRNRGVGTRLLDALQARSRDDGLEFVLLWPSERATSMYRRAGFQPVEEVHSGEYGPPPLAWTVR